MGRYSLPPYVEPVRSTGMLTFACWVVFALLIGLIVAMGATWLRGDSVDLIWPQKVPGKWALCGLFMATESLCFSLT